jgi:hypothetical protein
MEKLSIFGKSEKYQASPLNFRSSHPWNFQIFLAENLNISNSHEFLDRQG